MGVFTHLEKCLSRQVDLTAIRGEFFRVGYRATKKPYLVGGVALYSGYLSAFLRRMKRPVSADLMRFHRKEQMSKLKMILRSMFKLKRIDSFEIRPS